MSDHIHAQGPSDANAPRSGTMSPNPDRAPDQYPGSAVLDQCVVINIVVGILGLAIGYYFGRRKSQKSAKTGHG